MSKRSFSKEELKMPEENFGMSRQQVPTSYFGLLLGILIVFLACILVGLYLWAQMLQKNTAPVVIDESPRPTAEENNEPESTNAEADVQVFETLSTSDEISAIEADLDSTNTDTFDSDLTAIEEAIAE